MAIAAAPKLLARMLLGCLSTHSLPSAACANPARNKRDGRPSTLCTVSSLLSVVRKRDATRTSGSLLLLVFPFIWMPPSSAAAARRLDFFSCVWANRTFKGRKWNQKRSFLLAAIHRMARRRIRFGRRLTSECAADQYLYTLPLSPLSGPAEERKRERKVPIVRRGPWIKEPSEKKHTS